MPHVGVHSSFILLITKKKKNRCSGNSKQMIAYFHKKNKLRTV